MLTPRLRRSSADRARLGVHRPEPAERAAAAAAAFVAACDRTNREARDHVAVAVAADVRAGDVRVERVERVDPVVARPMTGHGWRRARGLTVLSLFLVGALVSLDVVPASAHPTGGATGVDVSSYQHPGGAAIDWKR